MLRGTVRRRARSDRYLSRLGGQGEWLSLIVKNGAIYKNALAA